LPDFQLALEPGALELGEGASVHGGPLLHYTTSQETMRWRGFDYLALTDPSQMVLSWDSVTTLTADSNSRRYGCKDFPPNKRCHHPPVAA
jgi:hypothetical protein